MACDLQGMHIVSLTTSFLPVHEQMHILLLMQDERIQRNRSRLSGRCAGCLPCHEALGAQSIAIRSLTRRQLSHPWQAAQGPDSPAVSSSRQLPCTAEALTKEVYRPFVAAASGSMYCSKYYCMPFLDSFIWPCSKALLHGQHDRAGWTAACAALQ